MFYKFVCIKITTEKGMEMDEDFFALTATTTTTQKRGGLDMIINNFLLRCLNVVKMKCT